MLIAGWQSIEFLEAEGEHDLPDSVRDEAASDEYPSHDAVADRPEQENQHADKGDEDESDKPSDPADAIGRKGSGLGDTIDHDEEHPEGHCVDEDFGKFIYRVCPKPNAEYELDDTVCQRPAPMRVMLGISYGVTDVEDTGDNQQPHEEEGESGERSGREDEAADSYADGEESGDKWNPPIAETRLNIFHDFYIRLNYKRPAVRVIRKKSSYLRAILHKTQNRIRRFVLALQNL